MRRIVAILLVVFVGFWIAYGLYAPFREDIVNPFFLQVAGPTIYYGLGNTVRNIVASIGFEGFAAIIAVPVFVFGIIAHHFWVKADWHIRRWGSSRTARDLGVASTASLGTTPVGATTRPTTTEATAPIVEALPKEETKEEEAKA